MSRWQLRESLLILRTVGRMNDLRLRSRSMMQVEERFARPPGVRKSCGQLDLNPPRESKCWRGESRMGTNTLKVLNFKKNEERATQNSFFFKYCDLHICCT